MNKPPASTNRRVVGMGAHELGKKPVIYKDRCSASHLSVNSKAAGWTYNMPRWKRRESGNNMWQAHVEEAEAHTHGSRSHICNSYLLQWATRDSRFAVSHTGAHGMYSQNEEENTSWAVCHLRLCCLKGPIHDQSCCAKMFCATQVCPFTINHVAQICIVQHKFAQNMIPFTLPRGCKILVEFSSP
jgi:hypothetical protein